MNDREKLYELIDGFDVLSAPTGDFRHCFADYLISHGVTVQQWIPVTERLPKDRGNVLAVVYWLEKWQVKMAWCAPERNEWSVHVGFADRSDVTVTHWMPLPEPPEEGE